MDFYQAAQRITEVLQESHAEDVVLLDLRTAHIWTDFFVIATAQSPTQARGFERIIDELVPSLGLEEYQTKRKQPNGDEWNLIDFGGIVVHIMSPVARSFYDLEKLWFDSRQHTDGSDGSS